MAAKFLYIRTAADDAVTLPVESLQSISQSAGDTVVLEFLTDKVNGNIAVSLTTASNKEKEAVEDISNAIAFGKDQFLVIADDVSSDYVSSNLSAVGAIGRDVGPKVKQADITTATKSVLASESGTHFSLDRAGGIAVTLPTPQAGLEYHFYVKTTFTGACTISTATTDGTDGFLGSLNLYDTGANAAAADRANFQPSASNDVINLRGADDDTAGRLTGGWISLVGIDSTTYWVRGMLMGDGTLVTPFTN